MSDQPARARHRATDPITSPANTGPLARTAQHRQAPPSRNTAMTIATGGIMVLTTLTAPASAAEAPAEAGTETASLRITADPRVRLHQAMVKVATLAAPPPAPEPAPAPPVVYAAPAQVAPAHPPVVYTAPPQVSAPAPRPVISAPKAGRIASAALSQLGWHQDCTRLVSNSLLAVGINFHGWPAGYLSLGSRVSAAQAVPGDLLYYANGGMGVAHIAVYIGRGMAVHGGWNGNMTVTFSANVGSGPVYIRVA